MRTGPGCCEWGAGVVQGFRLPAVEAIDRTTQSRRCVLVVVDVVQVPLEKTDWGENDNMGDLRQDVQWYITPLASGIIPRLPRRWLVHNHAACLRVCQALRSSFRKGSARAVRAQDRCGGSADAVASSLVYVQWVGGEWAFCQFKVLGQKSDLSSPRHRNHKRPPVSPRRAWMGPLDLLCG